MGTLQQFKSGLKNAGGFVGAAVTAGDTVKDIVDPRTDLIKGVSFPNGSGSGTQQINLPGAYNGSTGTDAFNAATLAAQQRYVGGTTDGGYSSGGSGGGGGAAAPAVDEYAVGLYDQGISQANSAIGRLDNQMNIGNENINNAFNSSLNTLLSGKARTERDYTTNKDQSTKDNITARSNVDFRTGQRANALQRLLGSRGAGSSTAARVAAPYAAALEGTQARQQVNDSFGRNMQALDTSWGDYQADWNNSREDLDKQIFTQRNALQAGVAEKRQNLLSQLAQLSAQRTQAAGGSAGATRDAAQGYLNQVNDLGGQIDNLGRQFANPVSLKTPNYVAPELAKYNFDAASQIQTGNNSALTDTVNPYLSVLLNQRKKEQGMAL